MDCPHISCVKITRDVIKNKKNLCSTTPLSKLIWKCLDCSMTKDNWMCLNCATVLCGRYENGHALKHSGENTDHDLCMNTNNLSVYCYKCDEFVINDSSDNIIEELRQELKENDTDTVSETSSTLEEVSSSKSTQESVSTTSSTSSSDSGWEEPLIGRRLRPRKRTISNDSNNENSSTKQRKSNSTIKRVVGLRNLGNTCFMNSVLQSLSNIQEFSCYFNALPSLESKQIKQRAYHSRSFKENLDNVFVVEELRKVLLNLSQGGDGTKAAISPECLFLVIWKVVPQFRGHRQHDAHEFLRYMLDRLHTELQQVTILTGGAITNLTPAITGTGTTTTNNQSTTTSATSTASTNSNSNNSKNGKDLNKMATLYPTINSLAKNTRNSIVTNVFGGILQSEVRCLICGMESKKHDPFLDLSLDIPEKFYSSDPDNDTSVCNISDCLSSFTDVEELAETELYYCNSCKCKQKSTKRFWIRRLPNVLCLHIKRFRWNNFYRTKIDLRISFPINSLDMSQYVLNNGPETRRSNSSCNIYDLAAVIVHHGNGSSCGHYTSFAIHNGMWMHFNDHTVKEVSPNAVADCKPYILFYIRREAGNNKTS
uniref:Ubiquitin carboxyl-terminal hydrolase n=1 Tax=Corethrella appendiculata TaxID=1370023 RepID=U5EYW5_9DIPT